MVRTIKFKSVPKNWAKEFSGLKCNTLRKTDGKEDVRFDVLDSWLQNELNIVFIRIENTKTGEVFERFISDVTFHEGFYIISWNDKNCNCREHQ